MNEVIQTKLALQIAQLSLDKATLEAHLEELQGKVNQITNELEEVKKNKEEE